MHLSSKIHKFSISAIFYSSRTCVKIDFLYFSGVSTRSHSQVKRMTGLYTGPYFDSSSATNITAQLGTRAFLPCKVRQLGNKSVSDYFWKNNNKNDKWQFLSINLFGYLRVIKGEFNGAFIMNTALCSLYMSGTKGWGGEVG